MAWEVWLTFFGAAIAISVSPGAGAIQSMATGLTHGVRRGYWSILGLEIGLMLQLTPVAIGLGAAVANSILAFNIIKWIGVAYLIYLAVGATMVAVDLVVMGLYTGLSVRLLKWLHTPRKQTVLNRVFCGLFAAAAVVLSLVRRGAVTA